ncbi:MAG: DUF1775 domain-containing protein [Thaumarchaeota archaeon]|nr:DUF1775 domain-containing protein [Nitrososphaerota archaeon]
MKNVVLASLALMMVLVPYADARADVFVGTLQEHEIEGHVSEGLYIPTSYTGILETYTMVIRNEKNGSTAEVQIILPQGMQLVSAEERGGWKVSIIQPPSVPTPVMIWKGGSIDKGQSERFVFTVRNPSNVFVYYFVVVQSYEGGDNDAWRPWVQIIAPTNIAGIEFSTVAVAAIVISLALPFIERGLARIKGSSPSIRN